MGNVFATDARARLEAAGYGCDWKMVNNVAVGLFVKDGFKIVSLLDIKNGSIDELQVQHLLSDANIKKIRKKTK